MPVATISRGTARGRERRLGLRPATVGRDGFTGAERSARSAPATAPSVAWPNRKPPTTRRRISGKLLVLFVPAGLLPAFRGLRHRRRAAAQHAADATHTKELV